MSETVREHPILSEMVERLRQAAGARLRGVVLYGSAARGDYHGETSDFNLLVVLDDLEPGTLETLHDPFARWERKRQPIPRVFSPALIADAADVFPIELLDIADHHVVLHGEDPMAGLEVQTDHLRLQCERELREKLMRLREAYVETHSRPRDLERLLARSYTTFVAIFRGCLRLHGEAVPTHNAEVVERFCGTAGLDPAPFREVDEVKGGGHAADPKGLFARYYAELGRAVGTIDRFRADTGEEDR